MPTPWIIRSPRYVSREDKEKKDAEDRAKAAKALTAQGDHKPAKKGKSIFDKALKATTGLASDIGEGLWDAGGEVLGGFETYGNQAASVPAALFTKGKVEDGKYTTQRNLIGNPFANVASHVKAQRQSGIDTGTGLVAGFKAANRAGKAFNEDPDIPTWTKTGANIIFDPTSYMAAGAISKLPKLAAIGGAKGKLARGSLGILEGFDKPKTLAKFTAGAMAGSELGERSGLPGGTFVGSLAGGIGAASVGAGARGLRDFGLDLDRQINELAQKAGPVSAANTYELDPEMRLYRGAPKSPHTIQKGELLMLGSHKGDFGAIDGPYLTRDTALADWYAMEGDRANVTGIPQEKRQALLKSKAYAPHNSGYRAKRKLRLLAAEEPVTPQEINRIVNNLPHRISIKRNPEGIMAFNKAQVINQFYTRIGDSPRGSQVISALNELFGTQEWKIGYKPASK